MTKLTSKSGTDVQLGDVVEDSITGFKGAAIAITTWLHGCRRVIVQPEALKDGKPIEASTFDEPQLWIRKTLKHAPTTGRTGGPKDAASEAAAARR